jgi:hypothetical protein
VAGNEQLDIGIALGTFADFGAAFAEFGVAFAKRG